MFQIINQNEQKLKMKIDEKQILQFAPKRLSG